MNNTVAQFPLQYLPIIILDVILRGFALWRAAKDGKKWWFVGLLIINSAGVIPAVFLFLNRKKLATPIFEPVTSPALAKSKTKSKKTKS